MVNSLQTSTGVDRADPLEQGAGDQGLMFGYATNETDVLMPAPVTTSAWVDIEEITRNTVRGGYVHSDMGFDANSCAVLSAIGKQSPDINRGVDRADPLEQGAGATRLMFGYATNETDVLMPAPVTYAHRLVQRRQA